MNSKSKMTLAVLAGAALGAAAIQGLHAQAKPPAYAVVDISEITDQKIFDQIGPKAGPSSAAFGGKFIIRTNNITGVVGGTPPKRLVVIAFDSVEKANAWASSPAQKEVMDLNSKSTKSRTFIAEGMPN